MSCRSVSAIITLGLSVALARAAEPTTGPFDTLINNSPFGQSAIAAGQAGNDAAPLEFRGVFVDKGEYFFSLHEQASRSGQWVGLKESGQPFLVESYDSAKGTIQVRYRNQPLTLSLKRAQIIVQAPLPPVPAPSPSAVAPALVAPGQIDEANRLAQVAEEIRRRRALRSQGAMPQLPPGGSPLTPGSGLRPNPPIPVKP